MGSMALIMAIMILMTILNNMVNASIQEDDIQCLKSIKASIEDPQNNLKSWQFPNTTTSPPPGFICSFLGIECWNALENRVLTINLQSLGLKGKFPRGISKCRSLMMLNLSNNMFYGPIPSDISKLTPYIVSLSLSRNKFSGQIQVGMGNCSYLNALELDHNRLSGQIPSDIGRLTRLRKFSVANNLLVGQVPKFESGIVFNSSSYANNVGLCGYPLSPCQ